MDALHLMLNNPVLFDFVKQCFVADAEPRSGQLAIPIGRSQCVFNCPKLGFVFKISDQGLEALVRGRPIRIAGAMATPDSWPLIRKSPCFHPEAQ